MPETIVKTLTIIIQPIILRQCLLDVLETRTKLFHRLNHEILCTCPLAVLETIEKAFNRLNGLMILI